MRRAFLLVAAASLLGSAVYAEPVVKRAGMAKQDRDFRRAAKRHHGAWRLIKNMPESEKTELRRLFQDDPAAFADKIRQLADKDADERKKRAGVICDQRQRADRETRELAERYRRSADDGERAALRKKIEAKVRESYESAMDGNRQRLAEAEQRLKAQAELFRELKDKFAAREEQADAIIKAKVEKIISNGCESSGR